jgi:hypothetical protein
VSRFAADAVALCRRAPNSKTITFGAETVRGPVDIEDREEADAGGVRLVRRTVITIATASLPTVARQSTVTVEKGTTAEQSYVVRDIQLVDDGELRELVCAEAD